MSFFDCRSLKASSAYKKCARWRGVAIIAAMPDLRLCNGVSHVDCRSQRRPSSGSDGTVAGLAWLLRAGPYLPHGYLPSNKAVGAVLLNAAGRRCPCFLFGGLAARGLRAGRRIREPPERGAGGSGSHRNVAPADPGATGT